MRKKLNDKPWYRYAFALCFGAAFYVLLTHQSAVLDALRKIIGYISPVLVGLVLAYLMNPLFRFLQNKVFGKMRSEKLKRALALILTVLIVLAFFSLLVSLLIPQLVSSVKMYAENLSSYLEYADYVLSKTGLSLPSVDFSKLVQKGVEFVKANYGIILNKTVAAGKSVGGFIISFLLAIYILAEKDKLKRGGKRLMGLLLPQKRYDKTVKFLNRSDDVLVRYIGFSLLESLMVAGANAIFMLISGMSYVPLVSFVVGVTNLIPTFGPIIGAGIGAFLLVLVRPAHALWFLIFTVVLQTLDGYVLKPRLFGNSLGVSSMWILIAIIVGGKMFGVIGMLVAIPAAAIGVDLYLNYLIPWLEARKKRREQTAEAEQ